MLDWLLTNFTTDEIHISISLLTIIIVLYECKFEEPITFLFGKPKLFEGTKKQRILTWIIFIWLILNSLLMIKID